MLDRVKIPFAWKGLSRRSTAGTATSADGKRLFPPTLDGLSGRGRRQSALRSPFFQDGKLRSQKNPANIGTSLTSQTGLVVFSRMFWLGSGNRRYKRINDPSVIGAQHVRTGNLRRFPPPHSRRRPAS